MAAKKKPKKHITQKVKSENKIYAVFNNCTEATVGHIIKWMKSVDLRNIGKLYFIPSETSEVKNIEKHLEELTKAGIIESLKDIEVDAKDHIIIYETGKAFCTVDFPQLISSVRKKPDRIWNIRITKEQWNQECAHVYIVPGSSYISFIQSIEDSVLDYPRVVNTILKSLKQKTEDISIPAVEINREGIQRKSWLARRLFLFKFLVQWYYILPFKNIGKQFGNEKFQEPALYRGLCIWFVTILLFVLPIMSRKAGISGDEDRHYRHAGLVYNYYASGGKDTTALNTPKTLLHYYGQSFDNISYILVKAFKIENHYEFRHVLNALTGWVAILFTALLTALIARWRAALMAVLIMFLSPRFMGHALNNPVDIPFAMAGILTMYYIVKLNMEYPRLRFKNLSMIAVGIAMAISMRIGGLIFVGFAGMFTGLNFLFKAFGKQYTSEQNKKYFFRLVGYIILASIAGYLLGQVLWPYALQNPIKNPIVALNKMTNISNALRQLFEGKLIWSDAVPWYYYVKYMLYTIPILVFAGIISIIIYLRHAVSKFGFVNLFILLFSFVFPVAYIIYKGSNVYGGWRHLNFVYPTMVVFAVLGLEAVFLKVKGWKQQLIPATVILLLLINPARHMIKNYPHHYVYYNEIIGGMKGAYGEYETDYYFHSFREAAEWLKENVIENNYDSTRKVTVIANAGIAYHFKDVKDIVNVEYNRYYNRGEKDWDYGIFANSYIAPYQMKNNIWPPKGTIHTINVDGYPICAIVERKDKSDYYASVENSKGNYGKAVELYKKALQFDPMNEYAYTKLAEIYIRTGRLDDAIRTCDECMKAYKDYDLSVFYKAIALYYKGMMTESLMAFNQVLNINQKFRQAYYQGGLCYVSLGDYPNAIKYFDEFLKLEPNHVDAYYYRAQCYYNLKDYQNVMNNLNFALKLNPNHKPSYILMAEVYRSVNNMSEYQRLMNIANSLP